MKTPPNLKVKLSNGAEIEFPLDSVAGIVALEAIHTPDGLMLALLLKGERGEFPLLVSLPKGLIPWFLRRVREEVWPFVGGEPQQH